MPAPTPGARGLGFGWFAAIVVAALALGAAALLIRRRRAASVIAEQSPAAAPAPIPTAAAAPTRARLAVTLRPRRAGLNLLSATSENEIVVTNTGEGAAADIRVQVRLLSAHGDQAADLAAYHAEPIGRPVVAPFALAPGESRAVPATAALPRQAIRPLTAGGRPMFVPIVAVNIVYAGGAGGGEGQFAQAFAIGIERVDTPKLAPLWLDTPPRSYDQVAARAQPPAVDR